MAIPTYADPLERAWHYAYRVICIAIFVFLILALLVPVANFVAPSMTQTIVSQIDSSYITKILYNNNVLLLLLEGLF